MTKFSSTLVTNGRPVRKEESARIREKLRQQDEQDAVDAKLGKPKVVTSSR